MDDKEPPARQWIWKKRDKGQFEATYATDDDDVDDDVDDKEDDEDQEDNYDAAGGQVSAHQGSDELHA